MATLIFCFSVLFACFLNVSCHNDYDEEAWSKAGQFMKRHMDSTKKPCENFYDHVCGKFGPDTAPQADFENQDDVYRVLLQGLKDLDPKSQLITDSERSLKKFFDDCLSNEGSNEPEPKATSISYPWRLIGELKRKLGVNIFMNVKTEPKFGRNIVIFPETDLLALLKNAVDKNQTTDLSPSAMNLIEEWYEVFISATKIPQVQEDKGRKYPIQQLLEMHPDIDWQEYFDGLLPNSNFKMDTSKAEVILLRSSLFTGLARLLQKYEVYIFIVAKYIDQLRAKQPQKGEMICLAAVVKYQSPAAAKFYFKLLDRDISSIGQDLINIEHNMISAFRFLLNSVDWLEADDKIKVHAKLDHLTVNPAVPEWISNETRLLEETNLYSFDPKISLSRNVLKFDEKNLERSLKYALLLSEDDYRRPEFGPELPIVYFPINNVINIPLVFMTQPRYDFKYPLAVKYGVLGTILGHELMHAFDKTGFANNPHGAQEWVSEKGLQEFKKKTSCLIRQYSSYCSQKLMKCVSGTDKFNDNMADIDGIKIAYTAFKFATQVYGNDPPIPSMLNYTNDQLFFIANARNWCSSRLRNDFIFLNDKAHSPDRARVEVTMRNVPLFARAFECPVGSTYAPLKVCTVWGDLANPARKRK